MRRLDFCQSPPEPREPGAAELAASVCVPSWEGLLDCGQEAQGREGRAPPLVRPEHAVLFCWTPDRAPLPSQQPLPRP